MATKQIKQTDEEIKERYRQEMAAVMAAVKKEFFQSMGQSWLIFRDMEGKLMNDYSNKVKELQGDMAKELVENTKKEGKK